MSRAMINTFRAFAVNVRIRPSMRPGVPPSPSPSPSRAFLPASQLRWSSHVQPGGPPANARKPVTINTLQTLYRKKEPITMITAHDFPSAHVADQAGMDMILVGDSLAMVALGMEDTTEVRMEEMIMHCRSVARATKAAFTVLPIT